MHPTGRPDKKSLKFIKNEQKSVKCIRCMLQDSRLVFFLSVLQRGRQRNTHAPCWETPKPTKTYRKSASLTIDNLPRVMAIPSSRLTREPTTPPRKQARYHAETPEKHTTSHACVGSVMSLLGSDGRVRPNAETCTLKVHLGGSRWQVEMSGDDLKKVDESQLAPGRQTKRMSMPASSMEPSQSSLPAQGPAQITAQGRAQSPATSRIQQWIKVGTGEPSYPSVFFVDPTQGISSRFSGPSLWQS